MQDKNKKEIFTRVTKLLRQNIVKTSHFSKIPHLGSCLSCVDLLVFLYWFELKFDLENLNDPNRDIFVLSKGHGAPALFQVLARGNIDGGATSRPISPKFAGFQMNYLVIEKYLYLI